MTVITREDLKRVDEKIAWLNTRKNIPVEGLDRLMAESILKTNDSVFNSNDKDRISMKNCQRLAYYINYVDDREYPNSVFSLDFRVNLEDSENIKADFTNCLVKKGSISYNIYDLDDEKAVELWNKEKEYAVMLTDEAEEHLREKPNMSQDELKELLEYFTYAYDYSW